MCPVRPMQDSSPPNSVTAMNSQQNERSDQPSDVPPRLTYRDPADRNERRDKNPSLLKTRSRLRIDTVIRAVRERKSRGR